MANILCLPLSISGYLKVTNLNLRSKFYLFQRGSIYEKTNNMPQELSSIITDGQNIPSLSIPLVQAPVLSKHFWNPDRVYTN